MCRAGLLAHSLPSFPFALSPLHRRKAGSYYAVSPRTPSEWAAEVNRVSNVSGQTGGSAVPPLIASDCVHGAVYVKGATFFPGPIGTAATFSMQLAETAASVVAAELRAVGIQACLGPLLGVTMSPFWSRMQEGLGEDPVLVSAIGSAVIRGLQREGNISQANAVAATAKHFIGYSFPNRNNKDRTAAEISKRTMMQYFLPPFRAALNAGVRSFVASPAEMNGIPVHANNDLLTTMLKTTLNFNGALGSDFRDVAHLYSTHRVASSMKQAALMAVSAGIDLSMEGPDDGFDFADNVRDLLEDSKLVRCRVENAIMRTLQLKSDLGLLEENGGMVDPDSDAIKAIGSREHRDVALSVARKSITLMKNDGNVLPIASVAANVTRSILVAGPASDSLSRQNGGWSINMQGAPSEDFPFGVTVLDGVRMMVNGTDTNVTHVATDAAAAAAAAAKADYSIVCVGEAPYAELAGNLVDLDLDADQLALVKAVQAAAKGPVIVVMIQGRPRTIPWIFDNVPAIFNAYLPGSEGGQAIAELIFGVTADGLRTLSPAGHLPYSYPYTSDDIGQYFYTHSAASSDQGNTTVFSPARRFASGLTYTEFEISSVQYECPASYPNPCHISDDLSVSVTAIVKNKGSRTADALIPLFIRDVYSNVTQPEHGLLQDWILISQLGSEESETIQMTLFADNFAHVGIDYEPAFEEGLFQIILGSDPETQQVLNVTVLGDFTPTPNVTPTPSPTPKEKSSPQVSRQTFIIAATASSVGALIIGLLAGRYILPHRRFYRPSAPLLNS